MSNCVDIFMFEIKKIAGRKITVCAYFLMLVVTIFINLQSIPLYSIGSEGEQTTVMTKGGERGNDWNAFFHGLTIRWIDTDGREVKKKVSPMEYIRLQRMIEVTGKKP